MADIPHSMAGTQRNGSSSHSLEMANSNQELVTRVKARRWKTLGLVIAAAITIAVLATVLVLVLQKSDDAPQQQGDSLSLDDFLKRRFAPRQFNATWISDTELYYDEGQAGYEPIVYDIVTNKKRIPWAQNVTLEPQTFQTELSADGKFALESFSYRAQYRHSYVAYHTIIDTQNGYKYPLTVSEKNQPVYAQLVVWGPVGSALAIVVGNDIYYRPSAVSATQRLTTTGIQDTVYNGVPDWVYEEEVLSSNKALWFAPDGSRLSFATYNDTAVPVMTLPYYGRPGELLFQYTRALNIRYPKPGTVNPEVTLTVVDLATNRRLTIEPPPGVKGRTPIELPVLAMTQWLPDTPSPRLLTVWMNRVQNHAIIEVHDVSTGPSSRAVQMAELKQDKGWIELFEEGVTGDGPRAQGRVLLPISQNVGDDGFTHIARFDPTDDRSQYKKTFLTNGSFVVTSILSWDSYNGYVYFVSTAEGDPAKTMVQRVKDDPQGAPHPAECLSCDLDKCQYATASTSKNNSHIAITCLGPNVPATVLLNTAGKELQKDLDWERNEAIRQGLAKKRLPVKKRMTAPLPGKHTAQVQLWLPPDADLSGKTQYPMVVDVYGGPNSFRVSERFAVDWGSYLASNRSIIYAAIDGRGSGQKGDNNIFSIYHSFGTYEVEDQINVTKYLQKQLPYVDASKTAIWGWSYGGYASAMALAEDSEGVFKCGMSVAPVTDWIYYDSIYTERYMGLPTEEDNRAGYKKAQLTNKVENFRNKFFLLVHGTLDDNVHYQQSMMLSRALEENDILFRQQSYPDEEHGITGLQPHLYHTLQNFLSECFE